MRFAPERWSPTDGQPSPKVELVCLSHCSTNIVDDTNTVLQSVILSFILITPRPLMRSRSPPLIVKLLIGQLPSLGSPVVAAAIVPEKRRILILH